MFMQNMCLERYDYYVDNDEVLQTILRNENVAQANREPNRQQYHDTYRTITTSNDLRM